MPKARTAKTKLVLKASLIFSALLLVGTIIFISGSYPEKCTEVYRDDTHIVLGNMKLDAEVANTVIARQKGLSDRLCIQSHQSMLFVFDDSGEYGIWMKHMKFSIDIVWVDSDKKVIALRENVSPETYPEVFYPSGMSKYVLEVPAGTVSSSGVRIGDQLAW